MCLCWTVLSSIIYSMEATDIFHLHRSPHTLLHLNTNFKKNLRAALSFSIYMSFPLSPYHLSSHLWQDTAEQLPGPDLYLCNTLLRFATSSCLLLPSPHDPTSLSISALWSVLCGSSSISEQKHTLIPICPHSVEYTARGTQQMA